MDDAFAAELVLRHDDTDHHPVELTADLPGIDSIRKTPLLLVP
jgi:hypothetical protein